MNLLQVLLSVQSKGTEAVGALQRSVNSLTEGIRARAEAVQKFNRQISNGEAALRQWGTLAAAAFSVTAMRNYMREAEQADKAQRKLLQALRETGQAKAAPALERQQAALQRVTNATDDQISVVQRLLVQNGLSVDQTLAMTESVLDFAEATGQSYESAAALVGKSLRDNGEELGRYNIRLDGSKDRYTALRTAIDGYAGGQARAAVVDKEAHAAKVDIAEAGERMGRALNTLVGPVLTVLVPAVEMLADWLGKAVTAIRPFAKELGVALLVIGAVSGLAMAASTAFRVWLAVVNPLRVAMVALSGTNFTSLNRTIGAISSLKEISLTTWGERTAAAFNIVGAAIAGWTAGTIINKLKVAGLQIETWTSRTVNLFYLWADLTGAAAEKAWVWLKFRFLNRLEEGKLMVAEFADFVAATLNRVLRRDLIPRDGLRAAVEAARAELGKLSTDEQKAFATIEARMAQARSTRAAWDRFIVDVDGQDLSQAPDAPVKQDGGRPPRGPAGAGEFSAELAAKVELEQKRLLFDLETRIAEARARGDQAQVDQLTRARDEMQMLVDLGGDQLELVNRRLDATQALQDQERGQAEAERSLSQQLGDLARDRALIEADRYRTEEQKQAAILPLLEEENRLITERIALLEKELLVGATDQRRGQILNQLDQLRGQQAQTGGAISASQPQSMWDGMREGAVGFWNSIGTLASQTANGVRNVWQSTANSIQGALYGVFTRTMSLGQGLKSIAIGFGQSMLQSFTQMVADYAAKKAAMFAIDLAFNAKSLAMSMASAAKSLVAWMPSAIAASISSWGIAAALGVAAVVGAIGLAKGFSDGGPTGPGPKNRPAGVVHAGEWVAPQWMVEDPRYAPMIEMLEAARTRGYSLGGFVKRLASTGGVPKWMLLKPAQKFFAKTNLVNGTAWYGERMGTQWVDDSGAAARSAAAGFASLPGRLDAGMTRPYEAASGGLGGGNFGGGSEPRQNITVINVQEDRAATRIARRSAAAGDIVYIVRNNKAAIFGTGS